MLFKEKYYEELCRSIYNVFSLIPWNDSKEKEINIVIFVVQFCCLCCPHLFIKSKRNMNENLILITNTLYKGKWPPSYGGRDLPLLCRWIGLHAKYFRAVTR